MSRCKRCKDFSGSTAQEENYREKNFLWYVLIWVYLIEAACMFVTVKLNGPRLKVGSLPEHIGEQLLKRLLYTIG